jgi:chaperonin cofactor prefoldin
MAKRIPCFLCSQKLDQRSDKKHSKPYFICDACGVQIFVRGQQGIKNLAELIATLREHDFPFQEHAAVLFQIQALLTEIRGIKKEIEKLDSVFEIFSKDVHRERARELLNQRIETLLERLERIADGNDTIQTR